MPRVLSIATLYPNAHVPRFGTFVARQLEALAARDGWQVTVINPIGVPPVPMRRYKALAVAAVSGVEAGVDVRRPRFTLIPAVGGPFNPTMIVRAALPLARKLHAREPVRSGRCAVLLPRWPCRRPDRSRTRLAAEHQGARGGYFALGRQALRAQEDASRGRAGDGAARCEHSTGRGHGSARPAAREDHRALHRAGSRTVSPA